MTDWTDHARRIGEGARQASRALATVGGQARAAALLRMADALRQAATLLLEANGRDVAAAQEASLAAPMVERLRLSEKRVGAMADAVSQIAAQTDPVGQVIEGFVRPNGLRIEKVRSSIGVVLFIYESRPNVTSDAAALCLKSGNAIILRGGKESIHSNRAIAGIIASALKGSGIDPRAVQLVDSIDRAALPPLLKLDGLIDLVIPRGGESLIRAVVEESTIPVLKHFTGNCHLYIDAAVDGIEQQTVDVCVNAKTGYPGGGVCNAVEHILVHEAAAARILPRLCAALAAKNVEIRGDERVRAAFPNAKAATDADWETEYLSLVVGIKVVGAIDEAIDHINIHGSHHTDGILTSSIQAAERFVQAVDSGSVMVNASTRFADGGEYGLGAEVGISTDKLHARGPMGAMDLTTYKWVVRGNGHLR